MDYYVFQSAHDFEINFHEGPTFGFSWNNFYIAGTCTFTGRDFQNWTGLYIEKYPVI